MQSSSISLLGAALLLPLANIVEAASPPERAQVSFKYLDYQDYQTDQDRVGVKSPAVAITLPFAESWSLNSAYVSDSISGASPRYYTYDSRGHFSEFKDLRKALDLALTKYFARGTLTLGTNYSHESDYLSRGYSIQGTASSENNNSTLNLGVSVSNDDINPSNHIVVNEKKHVIDWVVGLTHALTPQDVMQINLGYSAGSGYFNDPYKAFDVRPASKDHTTLMFRWNHYFTDLQLTSHLAYRFYNDTFGVNAQTINFELVKPLSNGWTVMPLLRVYAQTAADFYREANPADRPAITFPDSSSQYSSLDQRLSGFGAITYGLKVTKAIGNDWVLDVKYEKYQQKTAWNFVGHASQGLDSFEAKTMQLGVTRYF